MSSARKGCEECCDYWFNHPRKLPDEASVNMDLQVSLRVCGRCGAYWEVSQRFARILDEEEARQIFPRYFGGG